MAHIAEKHHLELEQVFAIAEESLAAAYKKEYGQSGMEIKAKLDTKTGKVRFWQVQEVIDHQEEENHFKAQQFIELKEAEKIKPKVKIGDTLLIPLPPKTEFGRIATQTAKQVLLQKVKETQREVIYQKYKQKEGEVISGIVQRAESSAVFFDLGDGVGILPVEEKMEGESYPSGRRFHLYILSVEKSSRGPVIFLSRAYPKLISRLFESEVPELTEGQLTIKSIAREAGSHCKVAVVSNNPEVDPIGAMVGQRGSRILTVTNELNGEKIDIIKWASNSQEYIANALAPAKVVEVKINDQNAAIALVDPDQLSLAIGRRGQNVRLAAKLTGWKIDIQSTSPIEEQNNISEEAPKEEKKEDKKVQKKSKTKKVPAKKAKPKKAKPKKAPAKKAPAKKAKPKKIKKVKTKKTASKKSEEV